MLTFAGMFKGPHIFRRFMVVAVATMAATTLHAAKKTNVEPSYAWEALPPLGLRSPVEIDTAYLNYSMRYVPSLQSPAFATTGNYGAPGINMLFFERQPMSDFFFSDALAEWLPSNASTRFYNTRIPMTLMSYNFGGGKQNSQERFHTIFSGNINSRAQVGAMVDYIYSKGSYSNQADKDLSWGASGSYMGDRYEFQGYFNHFNFLNKENGGITDDLYITDPAQVQGGATSVNPKAIPTRLSNAHSKIVGSQLMLNNRYKVGYYHEEQVNDTTVKRTYIPVSSFIWTFRYDERKHLFLNGIPGEGASFWPSTYLSAQGTYDRTTFNAVTNTLGVSLLEGFHKYAKFGLGAYATYQYRKYHQTLDTISGLDAAELNLTPFPEGVSIPSVQGQHLLWAGAQLTKQRGSILTYSANAEIGLVGPVAGDIKIDGELRTRFRLRSDTVAVIAYGKFSNLAAPYLVNNYVSNHFVWQNDFGKERRFRAGGRLELPFVRDSFSSRTALDAGVENIQNYIYFGPESLPLQCGDNIQVFSATINQDLRYRAFNWENRITYQTSSRSSVIPLPKLVIYSNLYFLFKIARVLHVQAGIDFDFYTKYTGLDYQPATMTFHTQSESSVGGFPFMNAYINMKLSKTHFYVMYSHFNQGWLGGHNYFSLPHYPLNPARFQMGVSIDFAN